MSEILIGINVLGYLKVVSIFGNVGGVSIRVYLRWGNIELRLKSD